MPYVSEKIALSPEQDRRRKLMDDDKEAIRVLYGTGRYSMNDLAKDFGVSKTTVLRIVNPASAQHNLDYSKAHWREHRQTKEQRAASARNTRQYKQHLYLSGALTKSDNPDNERDDSLDRA